ncbi:MAG TPA: 50S ribosomal protein L24 [Dehalococcoidia bacterium]|nr:50S ribosomal protein L24 [Chloroflexota bacterium]HCI86709.1 50S ribosomal protein L24 [Dehalococcoidia bacterium]|tara:strand:- start:2577 stop:2891 length:315 start_codon:yes stop_codon:yes gene_type:complete
MAQTRIKRDDEVLVISGKDKGKRGSVIRVLPAENRVVVEGVNVVTRHIKAQPGIAQTGLVQGEAPISLSNVMLIDPETGNVGRTGQKVLEDGTKVRVVKSGKRS